MKIKPAIIGILLMGLISACGVNDSHKETFNPHIDGLWLFQELRSIPCEDSGFACKHYHDFYYVSIDYPNIHACQKRYDASDDDRKTLKARKENVKIDREEDEFYKIRKDNGDAIHSDSLTFKMITDTLITSMKQDTIVTLTIYKKLPDSSRKFEGFGYSIVDDVEGIPGKQDYQQCRRRATDATGLLFYELPLN